MPSAPSSIDTGSVMPISSSTVRFAYLVLLPSEPLVTMDRLIEVVLLLDVLHHLRRVGALGRERAARREADEHEHQRRDEEQRRDDREEAADDERCHAGGSLWLRKGLFQKAQ
jgi:hypothetical protein